MATVVLEWQKSAWVRLPSHLKWIPGPKEARRREYRCGECGAAIGALDGHASDQTGLMVEYDKRRKVCVECCVRLYGDHVTERRP
jgi:hypothetical protein